MNNYRVRKKKEKKILIAQIQGQAVEVSLFERIEKKSETKKWVFW